MFEHIQSCSKLFLISDLNLEKHIILVLWHSGQVFFIYNKRSLSLILTEEDEEVFLTVASAFNLNFTSI